MKITVEHKDTKISVEEYGDNNRMVTMKYSDENKSIQETIAVIVEQVQKLQSINPTTREGK